jgi:isopentenyl-diphosphate Delta-isomerase
MELVIEVDEHDQAIGSIEKLDAHRKRVRHRAFSVFLFAVDGKMLVQRRSLSKYHSPGLWANACCGHPRPGEQVEVAAIRRVKEELGVTLNAVTKYGRTAYSADLGGDMGENEIVHLFTAVCEETIKPAASEVAEVLWIELEKLAADMASDGENFAFWFKHYLREFPDLFATR